jgi:hypothetical protein
MYELGIYPDFMFGFVRLSKCIFRKLFLLHKTWRGLSSFWLDSNSFNSIVTGSVGLICYRLKISLKNSLK